MNFNKVIIGGNITKDPELKTVGDTSLCNISVAINRNYKNNSGEVVEQTTFVDATCWGRTAENVAKYMTKGSPVLIEGELTTQKWEDKTTGKQRSKLSVKANIVQFLGTKKAEDGEF